MTRKDYILIAAALNAAKRKINDEGWVPDMAYGVNVGAEFIADALIKDNPRFDRERFLTAVGVQS